jgi:hypothetical protein
MKPWSYSSLSSFETCPRRYHLVRVARAVVEPPSEAAAWGTAVHEALERRVKHGEPLPIGMTKYEPFFKRLETVPGERRTEEKFGLTKYLAPCDFDARDCWFRGIVDLSIRHKDKAFIADYKTGKVRENFDQLTLFALAYMRHHPEVERVRAAYLWLQHNMFTCKDIKREGSAALWHEFELRYERLRLAHECDEWKPNPTGLCRGWCPVGRELCEYWRPNARR